MKGEREEIGRERQEERIRINPSRSYEEGRKGRKGNAVKEKGEGERKKEGGRSSRRPRRRSSIFHGCPTVRTASREFNAKTRSVGESEQKREEEESQLKSR